MEATQPLTVRTVFRFWYPLALTWLMMAIEGPFVSAVIARMPEPKYQLAAYGVAFALALIVEAPVIMLMSGVVALLKDRGAFRRLWIFSRNLSIGVTLALAFLLIPPVFDILAIHILALPEQVVQPTHIALLLLLPWPLVIGIRRFYQGVLIRHGQTRKVAYGTGFRLLAVGMAATMLSLTGVLDGAATGALTLSIGVTVELLVIYWMTRPLLRTYRPYPPADSLSYREILRFYVPLALTSVITLATSPMLTFFMGRARLPIESLAVYPVVGALVFIFRSVGISFQEVVVALLDPAFQRYRLLARFAWGIALAAVAGVALVGWTPVGSLWYHTISGLSLELTHYAIVATQILCIIPGLTAWLAFERGVLMTAGTTVAVSNATVLEIAFIGVTMWIAIAAFDMIGIFAAAMALVVGRLVANLYLYGKIRRLQAPAPASW